MEVRHHRVGLELPALGLWLDPRRSRPLAFISHAHSDHIGAHREVILTPATARFLQARLPGQRIEHHLPFDEPFHHPRLPGTTLRLLPAGHLLGSAQLHLTTDSGTSLLYTGDFKLRPSLTAETALPRPSDILILETTFGLPRYRFPPREKISAAIAAFCHESWEAKAQPVFFAYSLGKAQELIALLATHGIGSALHPAVWEMTEIYRSLGVPFPLGYTRLEKEATLPGLEADQKPFAIITPPRAVRSGWLERFPLRRTAVVSGWALDSGARYRYQADAAFPLSDHADYDELLRYVEAVAPRLVYTVHGFTAPFAADLRRRGVEAWALGEDNQLELGL